MRVFVNFNEPTKEKSEILFVGSLKSPEGFCKQVCDESSENLRQTGKIFSLIFQILIIHGRPFHLNATKS